MSEIFNVHFSRMLLFLIMMSYILSCNVNKFFNFHKFYKIITFVLSLVLMILFWCISTLCFPLPLNAVATALFGFVSIGIMNIKIEEKHLIKK